MNEDAIFGALRHPLRRAILKRVIQKGEPVSPTSLAKELEVSLNRLSYHVRKLDKVGALILVDTQPVRGTTRHYYSHDTTVIGTIWVREVLGLPLNGNEGQ